MVPPMVSDYSTKNTKLNSFTYDKYALLLLGVLFLLPPLGVVVANMRIRP